MSYTTSSLVSWAQSPFATTTHSYQQPIAHHQPGRLSWLKLHLPTEPSAREITSRSNNISKHPTEILYGHFLAQPSMHLLLKRAFPISHTITMINQRSYSYPSPKLAMERSTSCSATSSSTPSSIPDMHQQRNNTGSSATSTQHPMRTKSTIPGFYERIKI